MNVLQALKSISDQPLAISSQLIADKDCLQKLDRFQKENHDWIFGHISYDVKNEIENLTSSNPDGIGFPDIHFFVPEIVLILKKNELQIGVDTSIDAQKIYEEIISRVPAETIASKKLFFKKQVHTK